MASYNAPDTGGVAPALIHSGREAFIRPLWRGGLHVAGACVEGGSVLRYFEQRLKLRHLRVVDAITEHKSLLRAADALGVSQPALTRTLREIEEIVGLEIFERHARGMRPNDVGLLLVEGARAMLRTVRQMEDDLTALAEATKWTIRVGSTPVAALGLMPAVIANTSNRAAKIRIELAEGRTDQLIPALERGEIDVIVGRLYPPAVPDGLTRRVLYHEPMSLIAAAQHPLFATPSPSPQALAACTMVLPPIRTVLEREVRGILEALALRPDHSIHTTSVAFTREMLFNGDFVTIMPRMLVASDIARGTLRVLPVELPPLVRPAGLIHRGALGVAGSLILSEISRELARLVDEGIIEVPRFGLDAEPFPGDESPVAPGPVGPPDGAGGAP